MPEPFAGVSFFSGEMTATSVVCDDPLDLNWWAIPWEQSRENIEVFSSLGYCIYYYNK